MGRHEAGLCPEVLSFFPFGQFSGCRAWRDREGTSDVGDAEERLSPAIRAVLDLPNLSAISREKLAEPSTPSGTPLFA